MFLEGIRSTKEFDVQQKLLIDARKKLEELEHKIDNLLQPK